MENEIMNNEVIEVVEECTKKGNHVTMFVIGAIVAASVTVAVVIRNKVKKGQQSDVDSTEEIVESDEGIHIVEEN